MAKIVEVYPKIGCVVDADPTGFSWPAGIKLAMRDRIQGIADGAPGVTVDDWHIHPDEGGVQFNGTVWSVRLPKLVVWFRAPNNATHAGIIQAFTDDGFLSWVKTGITNRLPGGVTVTRWRGKLMTNLGKTVIDEAGP